VPFCDTIKYENLKDMRQEMNFIFCILDVEKKNYMVICDHEFSKKNECHTD